MLSDIRAAIARLPDMPTKHMVWIVYNDDFVEYTETQIKLIKGEDYLKNITVTPRSSSSKYAGTVIFDPKFFDHISNGAN